MNTPKLTIKRAKYKLLKAIFKFSILVLIAGSIGYFSVQQTTSNVFSKGDVIQHWLRGDINQLRDPHLESILDGLANKLVKIGKDVRQSDSPILKLELVTAEEFDAKHRNKLNKRAYLAGTEVNLDMGLIARAKDPRYTNLPVADNPERASVSRVGNISGVDNRDRERFSKGLQDLYSVVDRGVPNAQSIDLAKYSDVLLKDYFDVYEIVKEHYPGIQVLWVYIAGKETGTLALYPAPDSSLEVKLDERVWYSTSIGDKAYTGVGERTPEQGEQIAGRPDVGLTPFYGDFISGGFMRTLWHRFTVETPTENSTYVVCVDLIMQPPTSPTTGTGVSGIFSNNTLGGKLGNAVAFGLILSMSLFILGTAFIKFGGSWSGAAARRFISDHAIAGPSSSGYVVEPVSKVYMEYAEPADLRQDDTVRTSNTETTRGGIGIKTPHLNIGFEQQIQEESSSQLAETRRLGVSQDEKWKIRGKELWTVYTRQQTSGTCRLCDQEIAQYGDEQRIGSVEIIHRMNHEPEVDFKRKRGAVAANSEFIENNLQWHALNTEEEDVESGTQPLEIYPKPRVPQQFAGYRFIEDILVKYRRLNEGRYVTTNEFLQVSEAVLKDGIVQSVYRISHMRKLLSDSHGKDHLKLGKDIKRFLVASTDEELQQFRSEFRPVLADLQASQKLLFAVFRGTPLAVLDSYKELNFSILTLPNGSDVVLVAQPESINSGYVSWREVDISYYVALFKQIDDIAAKLSLDEE